MSIRPSLERATFVAKRVFAGRDGPKAAFLRALAAPQAADAVRVLAWHGPDGCGKSALRRSFEHRLAQEQVVAAARPGRRRFGWATLDFETPNQRTPEQALLALRLQLGASAGIGFPAFDTAFARSFALSNPGADLRAQHPDLFPGPGGDTLLDHLLHWSRDEAGQTMPPPPSALPGFALLYRNSARLTGPLRGWWQACGRAALAGLDTLCADDLADGLQVYLGSDIAYALTSADAPRLVLLMDGYEALWRDRGDADGATDPAVDDWVRRLVRDGPGLLVAVFGRDSLAWPEIEPAWREAIEQHPLDPLSDEEADHFLRTVPIADAAIRRRIVAGAAGLPFTLDLQVDLFVELTGRGDVPVPEAFAQTPDAVLPGFLNRLSVPTAEALRLASYPRLHDAALLTRLADQFLADGLDWPRLAGFGALTAPADGPGSMHRSLRDALQRAERTNDPKRHAAIHRALFAWHDDRLRAGRPATGTPATPAAARDASLVEALYHLSEADPAAVAAWALDRTAAFEKAARWRLLEPFWCQATAVTEAALGPDQPDTARTLHALARVYRALERHEQAERLLSRVLAIDKPALGVAHPETAAALHDLADIRQILGRHAEAESLFEQALAIKNAVLGTTHPDYAATLHALARLRQALGRYAEAEALYDHALEIAETALGADHPDTVAALHGLARTRHAMGRYAEAERPFERVLAVTKATRGHDQADYAATLHDLAQVRQKMGRYAEAEPLYEQAMAIAETTLGTKHPSYAATLHDLAGVRHALGRYAEAEALYERALAIKNAAVGIVHPDYAATLHDLARLREAMGRHAEAIAGFEQVLAIYEETRGKDHPDYATTLLNLAAVHRALGRYAVVEMLYNEALEIFQAALGAGHPTYALAAALRAGLLAATGRTDDARQQFRWAYAILAESLGADHPWSQEAHAALMDLEDR